MTLTATNRDCTPARPSLLATLTHMHAVWRQRQALKKLDDRALNDIGVSRAQASIEADRPIWDAPETWRA